MGRKSETDHLENPGAVILELYHMSHSDYAYSRTPLVEKAHLLTQQVQTERFWVSTTKMQTGKAQWVCKFLISQGPRSGNRCKQAWTRWQPTHRWICYSNLKICEQIACFGVRFLKLWFLYPHTVNLRSHLSFTPRVEGRGWHPSCASGVNAALQCVCCSFFLHFGRLQSWNFYHWARQSLPLSFKPEEHEEFVWAGELWLRELSEHSHLACC